MSSVAKTPLPDALTSRASSLEAARVCISAAVADLQLAARKAAYAEAAELEARGRPKQKRLKIELSLRDALRILSAQARLGVGLRAVNDAFRVFSDYWTGGGKAGEALELPSAIVLAKWVSGEQVMPLETAAQYIRRSSVVEAARQEVVHRLRQAQEQGISLDVAMRAMLSMAIHGADPAALEVAALLRRARDPRGGSRVGPWEGLPSGTSIWRWIGIANLAAGDLKPKRGGRRFPPPAWADALVEVEAANPGAPVNALHDALCKRLEAIPEAVNPSPWAVRRWIDRRLKLACSG